MLIKGSFKKGSSRVSEPRVSGGPRSRAESESNAGCSAEIFNSPHRSRTMTTSKRLAEKKSAKFQKNIFRRGLVPDSGAKKGNSYPVGPIVLGFFVFVVIGSALLQIIRTASGGGF